MFFDGWANIGRIVLTGACVYVALIALLRVSGKRTLAKLNAFDLVVTVALGSTLATALTSSQVTVVDGIAALATLVGLQFLLAWAASRAPRIDAVAKSQPRVVFHGGEFARDALRQERLTEDEIRAAVRQASVAGLDEVESVVLESSGDISVVSKRRAAARSGP